MGNQVKEWSAHLLEVGEGESDNKVEGPVEPCGDAHASTSEPERIDLRSILSNLCQ